MAESAAGSTGRIFISYRRDETAYPAGWLFDRLAEHFGPAQVFKDVDSIELGDDFVQVITRAVDSCDVLLALIGDEWLTITDEHGRRRLDDPNDFVRLEIEAALTRNVRIIPILVDGAGMPHADELPAGLVHRQALELSPSRFEYDTSRLIKVLDTTLANVRTALDDAAAISTSAMSPRHPSTSGVQRAPHQLEPTSKGGPPTIPPPATASPGVDRPPADQTKPLQKQSRNLSTRARVLTGLGAGTLILLLSVAIAAARCACSPGLP
jgi:TIR domain